MERERSAPTRADEVAAVALTWADEVAAVALPWSRERLAERGIRAVGELRRVKASAWSLVYRIPTDGGPVWFKASGGDTGYEAALARALADWVPDRVLTPLAVEPDRGWQLLPDGGPPLHEHAANTDARAWERFAAGYAELQRRVTPYAQRLLALGVPDHRPAAMPGHFDALLADPAVVIPGPRRAALAALRDRYADACARLAEAGPASTIQHDDLHSNNVLPGVAADRPADRFFDWGDASVGHPFTSLLVTLRAMADTFGVADDDPAVLRVRDAYLEPWGLDRARRTQAEPAALGALAAWTGTVGRALAWRRALVAAGPADLAQYGGAVGGWLQELLKLPDPADHSAVQG